MNSQHGSNSPVGERKGLFFIFLLVSVKPVDDEYIRMSRWKWLGHVFRKEGIVSVTSGWEVRGRRGRGRTKKTMIKEVEGCVEWISTKRLKIERGCC